MDGAAGRHAVPCTCWTEPGPWAPGYYSVLFEDPDGIRIEFNHVPGVGLLADGQEIGSAGAFDGS